MTRAAVRAIPSWLEVMEGGAPILLIAPHGGRAGPESHALLAPRVNDLHTAELTRELAGRLDADALINTGMDRNLVDCNRLGQVAARAPWLLSMIAERLERMVAEKGRALVLAIHGWNLIEPRVDIGVGLTDHGGKLAPSRDAHVSVSDRFLSGTLGALVHRLGRAGIVSTFGMRYPAGGAQNLVQACTGRHLCSEVVALRRIAALGARGVIEAVQLELSIALRFPGTLRHDTVESVVEVLARESHAAAGNGSPITVARRAAGPPTSRRPHPAVRHSARLGFEFYAPQTRIGAMASFDLGAGGGGGRVMILTPTGAVVLFTGERGARYEPGRLRVGPLSLEVSGGRPRLEFAGPALVTPAAETYINIERALSLSSLEMETSLSLEFQPEAPFDLDAARASVEADGARGLATCFGGFSGRLRVGANDYALEGVARIGSAFTALDDDGFEGRRMLWARSANGQKFDTVQAAEFFDDGEWRARAPAICKIIALDPPGTIRASVTLPRADTRSLMGEIVSCVPLVRPGAGGRRFQTMVGFAQFEIGGRSGFGMFEYSRPAGDAIATAGPDRETS